MIQQEIYQEEIYHLLASNPSRWFSQGELSELVQVDRSMISICLTKLTGSNDVEVKDKTITKFNEYWNKTQTFHIKCYRYK